MKTALSILAGIGVLLTLSACDVRGIRPGDGHIAMSGRKGKPYVVEVTGYCPCGACCGWRRNWLLIPVYSEGPLRGHRKKVGYTASGHPARPGTLAADTSVFPFGTILYIPGYGYGRVEDRGRDIKGYRIDVFFRHHSTAEQWGRKRLNVRVWFPPVAKTPRGPRSH